MTTPTRHAEVIAYHAIDISHGCHLNVRTGDALAFLAEAATYMNVDADVVAEVGIMPLPLGVVDDRTTSTTVGYSDGSAIRFAWDRDGDARTMDVLVDGAIVNTYGDGRSPFEVADAVHYAYHAVQRDVADGLYPDGAVLDGFGILHDYVDANGYVLDAADACGLPDDYATGSAIAEGVGVMLQARPVVVAVAA